MNPTKPIIAVVFTLLFLIVFSRGCRVVSKGYVGVQETFGQVHEKPLNPGLHWVKPFIDGVTQVDARLKSYEVEAKAASKDLQKVHTLISVQHSLNPTIAPAMLQNIGDIEQIDATVISPAVQESLKAITARYTAEELITHRDTVKQETSDAITAFINHTLQQKGVDNGLNIANVAIKDFDFSDSFNDSIEAKVKAQQESLRAMNEKTKRITEAEAGAAEVKLDADAQAYQIEQNSIKRAAAIEREAKALAANPLLLQLRATERWDGKLPTFMGAGQPVPFMSLTPANVAQSK